MSVKANIKAAKLKKAAKVVKDEAIDLIKDIKGININMDFEKKKHTIEVNTK